MVIAPVVANPPIGYEAPKVLEGTPTLSYGYTAERNDTTVDKRKEYNYGSANSSNPKGITESSSFDSLSTAEINLMLGKIRRARKKRYATAHMDDYSDSEVCDVFSPQHAFILCLETWTLI
jgi:hypothetical protein